MGDQAIAELRAEFHELAQTPGGQELRANRIDFYGKDGTERLRWSPSGEPFCCEQFAHLATLAWAFLRLR